MTIDEVINICIDKHLLRSNYNNINEVAATLEKIGIDLTNLRPSFPAIDEMMKRRHLIVHRADRVRKDGDKEVLQFVEFEQLTGWVRAVANFSECLLLEISSDKSIQDFLAKKFRLIITKD